MTLSSTNVTVTPVRHVTPSARRAEAPPAISVDRSAASEAARARITLIMSTLLSGEFAIVRPPTKSGSSSDFVTVRQGSVSAMRRLCSRVGLLTL